MQNMKIMKLPNFVIASVAFLSITAACVCAQETVNAAVAAPAVAAPAPTADDIETNVNAVGETLRLKVERFNHVRMKLAQIHLDPEFTSDAVEEKRREIKELQNAIIKAQIDLREEIGKLPAVKALTAETQSLNDEIQKLREQKESEMYKLRRARLDESVAEQVTAPAEQAADETKAAE